LLRAFPEYGGYVKFARIAGGWHEAVSDLENDSNLSGYPERRALLLIDSDKDAKRLETIRKRDFFRKYAERIFIISSAIEAEDLQKFVKQSNLEKTGEKLGENCSLWKDNLLNSCLNDACRLRQELTQSGGKG